MGTLSKLSSKCQKCPDKDECQGKRMEMCAYIVPQSELIDSASSGVMPDVGICTNEIIINNDISRSAETMSFEKAINAIAEVGRLKGFIN